MKNQENSHVIHLTFTSVTNLKAKPDLDLDQDRLVGFADCTGSHPGAPNTQHEPGLGTVHAVHVVFRGKCGVCCANTVSWEALHVSRGKAVQGTTFSEATHRL